MVLYFAEVGLAETQERRAVELGIATDVVVDARPERASRSVQPVLVGRVVLLVEDGPGTPILLFAAQVFAALENQNAKPGRGKCVSERRAPRTASDDDRVVRHRTAAAATGSAAAGSANGSFSCPQYSAHCWINLATSPVQPV